MSPQTRRSPERRGGLYLPAPPPAQHEEAGTLLKKWPLPAPRAAVSRACLRLPVPSQGPKWQDLLSVYQAEKPAAVSSVCFYLNTALTPKHRLCQKMVPDLEHWPQLCSGWKGLKDDDRTTRSFWSFPNILATKSGQVALPASW